MANSSSTNCPLIPFPGVAIVQSETPDLMKYMPDSSQANTNEMQGRVLAVGDPDISLYHPDVEVECPAKVGDLVVFSSQYNAPYKELTTGKEYRIIKFTDIKAKVKEDKK